MNRYWGRNENGSVPKFSRDDDQLMALNYENLCDGDYLNRLFSSDSIISGCEDTSGDSAGAPGPTDTISLFNADLPEDIILHGDNFNLGKSLARARFHKQILSSVKHQDAATNLINRQSIVYEHIGRLMIERCSIPPVLHIKQKIKSSNKSNISTSGLINNMTATALDCCLKLLDIGKCHNLGCSTLEPLVALVFHVSQESALKASNHSAVPSSNLSISAEHISILRSVFSQAAMKCHSGAFTERHRSAIEESFRSSMASFYGLLALGLHTRNPSEIVAAITHLMLILLRAEEWYAWFKAESKLQLSAALAAVATPISISANTPSTPVLPGEKTSSVTGATTKMAMKGKVAAESHKSKAGNKVNNPVPSSSSSSGPPTQLSMQGTLVVLKDTPPQQIGASPTALLSVPAGSTNSTGTSLIPSLTAAAAVERGGGSAVGGFVGNNIHILEQQQEDSRAESGPVEDLLPAQLIPTSNSHNSSIPNMKTWDTKQPNSKLPSDKERDHTPSRSKPMKNIKAEARVIQEILDPNMFTAQELSAYYASNPSTVNYVMKSNPNQGSEKAMTTAGNKQQSAILSKKPPGSSSSSSGVNNNNISLNDTNLSMEANFTRPDGHVPYRSASTGSNSNNNTSAAVVSRHKKNMAEFKESLQSLLRIPKPMLKVLHDCCVIAAADECEKRQISSVGLATNTIQNSSADLPASGSTPVSTYVWSCGQNSYGELGLGDSVMRKSFSRVYCLDSKRVVSIGAGNEHSLFVTQDGKLLTSGYNDNGQCGMGTTQQVRQPTVVTALEGEDIAQVHVYNGCEHTLAVTRDGKIFSFGYNYRGQLGLGSTTSEYTPRPIRGLLSRRVVLAACSYHHSVMLCSDGSVYSCGRNDSGQLGHGDAIDKKTPQSVLNCPRGIVSISCGQFHTVAATSSGSVFVCGKNDFGQLGLENTNMVKVFAELPSHPEIESVVQVCCGYYHTLLLSNTGIVAGFGRNDYGQLGLGHALQKVFTCTPITGLRDKGVRMVSAGCYHTVVVTTNGMLYVCGRNNHGQLATGDSEERHSPHPVDNFVGHHIISVAAGFYHTIVLTAAPSTTDGTSKNAMSTGSFLATKLGLSDVLEQLNSPIGLGDSPLHPIIGDARANAQSMLLMKDAAHLTGIKAPAGSRSAFIVPFSLDRLSRVSSRELLAFLTAHVESLVSTAAPQSTAAAESSERCEGDRVCAQWVANTLCCVVAAMELCCGIFEDTEGTSTLPLSFEEALYFISRLVKIAAGLLSENQTCILDCISSIQSQNPKNPSNPPANLQFLSEILSFDTKTQGNNTMKTGTIVSSKIMNIFKQCGLWENHSIENSNDSNLESKEKSAYEAMNLLRRKLLTVYFTLTPREQHQNPKFQTVVTEIALLFAQSHRILLPTVALVAEFYTVLRVYTMPPLTTSVSAFHQSLCVRMMTIFSATYRCSDEVVHMFQESKLDSLVVFRHMLSLYGHFSMHNLVKRIHLTKSTVSGVHQSTSFDVRRLISVLEQCISNFIKCAVPIIFAAGALNVRGNSSECLDSTQSLLFQSGVEIVREVLADAMRLVDYVQSQQSQSEDMLGQLRYGTIMPSILPSLLIYGIAFAKHRCLMLEIVPDVSRLIQKLQLLGRCDTTTGKAAVSLVVNKTELGSPTEKRALETGFSNLGGSFRAAVGQLGSSLSTALDRGGIRTPQGLLKEEEASVATVVDTVDMFSEDYLLSKRDPQQMSWWFRLVKLATTFVAKMSAALIAPPLHTTVAVATVGLVTNRTLNEYQLAERHQLVAYHNVWRFASVAPFITLNMPALLVHINTILTQELEQGRASEGVISTCAARREKEKAVDPVYRMLSLSVQSAFSTNILNLIEESLLEAVVKVAGQSTLLVGNITPVFKLVSRFTKRIHSRRSELVSHATSNTSWVELLITLNNVVKVFCLAVSEGRCCVNHHVPLVLPRGKAKGNVRAKAAWRRALLVVVCMKRWQTCWRLRMKNIAANVIDFVTVATSIVTDNLQCLTEGDELSGRIGTVLHTLALAGQEADNYSLGLQTARTLLGELSSNSLRSDVMIVLNAALREKADAMKLKFDADRTTSVTDSELSLQHCRTVALYVHPRAVEPMRQYLLNITSALRFNSGVFSQQELHLLSSSVRFMHLLTLENSLDMSSSSREAMLPLGVMKELLLQLRDHQQRATTANTSSAIDEKASKKPTANMREQNAAYRRTAQDLVSFLQAVATTESFHSLASRPYWCAQLVDVHNYLIATFQAQRIEAMQLDALNEEAARLSLDGKESTGQVTSTHVGLLISSSSQSNKPQSKDGNRRRCQDLITKPMEFCRTVEGFVVQGEKLLNNYKGVDFTVAFWVMLAKKSTAKYSFIAGKVSHSDSWPILLLRSDGKLEILYGHTSEVEKMISVASIAPCSWAHIAVIVEQKKIKLFVNGVLDCHVSTAKGNSKAVLYPLLVGSCPANVRTKVPQVKEGFDGMLAQFKYYSRALSPIHVKIVHDNGPPDTSDVTAKLIYQMLSSLKCLYKPVHPMYLQSTLRESAGIMHMVFVTDSSRRNRFAALHILTEILLLDVVDELDLWSNATAPSSTGADPQPVSLMKCSCLSKFASFHEKMVVYFIRLAGACWAPHLLASLESTVTGSEKAAESAGNTLPSGKLAESKAIHEFLRHAPSLAVSSDPSSTSHPYSLNASASAAASVVDKFAGKKEVRGEICNQVLGVLIKLATVKSWNTAISAVLRRTLESSTIFTHAMVEASLPLKFDTLGVSLLLGGGASGPYVGVTARSFFGDAVGKILSINRTTNFATLLSYNSIYAHQQVVKVRVSDLIVTARQDALPLTTLQESSTEVLPAVFSALDTLAGYMPLLLSDYMSSLRPPESMLQRTILKCLRPVEIFLFNQLLQAIVSVGSSSALSTEISSHPALLNVLQQASIAAVEVLPAGAQHHLGDNRAVYTPPSLGAMWLGCAHYLLGMPGKVVSRPLLATDDVKALCDFVSRNFGMPTDSILVAPHAQLLKQGRISELAQLLSLNDGNVAALVKSELGQLVEASHSNAQQTEQAGFSGMFLMSDWPPTFANDWPIVVSDSLRNELYCGYMLTLLFFMRKEIIANSRRIMAMLPTAVAGATGASTDQLTWVRDVSVWQAVLPQLSADGRVALDNMQDLLLQPRTTMEWLHTCAGLYQHKKVEVTQMIAASLKYYSLSLMQVNPLQSSDNLFESLDLFRRIMRAAMHWVTYADTQSGGEDVTIGLLRIILPILSFIDNSLVALQLTQLCMHLVRKLTARAFEGYSPSRELIELAKNNNFTLLRARAQEQISRYKTHNMGNISALAYNLTQLVCSLELIQRQGASDFSHFTVEGGGMHGHLAGLTTPPGSAIKASVASASKNAHNLHTARIQHTETAAPKISAVRATSVDCDMTACAESALKTATVGAESSERTARTENIIIEVAIGTASAAASTSGESTADCYFETVYCGTSLRLVQSNLVPECTYYLKCRAYSGATALAWSPVTEFRTLKGVLFVFDSMKCGPDIHISEDGLSASYGNDDTWSSVLGSRPFSSGVTHWSIRINSSSTAYIFVGVACSGADLSSFLGGCGQSWGFIGEQALYHNREKVKVYGESFSSGDVVGVTLDLNQGTMSFSRNNKPLGVAFDKIFGELYPAVAFYNVGQELEILSGNCSTTCAFESIPVSPSRMNLDDISVLNELALSLYRKQPLSHRLQALVAEHCNQWCNAGLTRCRAVSGRDVFLATQSPLLSRFALTVGERVRTPFGVAEVAGSAFNKVWFYMNETAEVWYFSVQQLLDGRNKKMFVRCSYDAKSEESSQNIPSAETAETDPSHHVTFDAPSVHELLEPSKWSDELDHLLLSFLSKQTDAAGLDSPWKVSSQQVTENFRALHQQFTRIIMDNHELTHRWGIAGPKRKAVLARIGLLRLFNQMLDMYLPFLVADSSSKAFVLNQPTLVDDFAPLIVSVRPEDIESSTNEKPLVQNAAVAVTEGHVWTPPNVEHTSWPLLSLSWDENPCTQSVLSREMLTGPIHAIRRLVFCPMKMTHFWEVLRRSTTRPAKTEDDYDYPDDLPHVKINRLKSFRAREASELLLIPGEDLMLSSMFCQLWRELRQHNDEKLRISYTHPMDDGQSRTFKIKFEGEGVDDYGGPYREIFQQICEELQSTDPSAGKSNRPSSWLLGEDKQTGVEGFATASSAIAAGAAEIKSNSTDATPVPTRCFLPLLMPTPNWTADTDCAERYRYMFHPAAESPLKMDLYHFLGQLVGIAVRSKITLDLAFPSYVWKYVVCERLTEHDIGSFDASAYNTLQRLGSVHRALTAMEAEKLRGETVDASALAMLQYNALELIGDLTWCYTRSDGVVLELIEGRGQQPVELADVGKYLVLYAEARLSEGRNAIGMFRKGIVSILPESSLSLLNWEELQAVICGPRTIDVQRLKDNTEYDDDISPDDEHIVLFWEVLSGFSEAEKSAFLRFVWARPTLPPKGVEFSQKMRVLSAVGEDAHMKPDLYLPKAHTCFFSINLPKYSTKQLMTEKLLYAIFNCTEMDADFRTTETDVAGWGVAATGPADWQSTAGAAFD